MTALLYRWPDAAKFGRVVAKAKFYEHASIGVSLKERFVSDVRRITWAYKLAEGTINLPGSVEVPEIQVFEIDAKEDDVAVGVLEAIDKVVRSPIIFEIIRGSQEADPVTRMVAAHKQLGGGTPKLGPYLSTDWQPASRSRSRDRVPLPPAIDLTSMYTELLQPLAPVAPRAGEPLSEVIGRLTTVRSLEREISALERKLRNEAQLNRKMALRRQLKDRQAALADLV